MDFSDSPVYVHFLRWLCSFVISHFHRNPQDYDEGYDPAGDVDRCVRRIHDISILAGRDGRWGNRLHPRWLLVILAELLLQSVFLVLATEAQVASPAAVTVVRVVALEHLVILTTHVKVAKAGVVVSCGRWLWGLLRNDRGDHCGFGGLPRHLFGLFTSRGCTQDAEGVQIYKQQENVFYPHGK